MNGFVTVATGGYYYKLALNLFVSYKLSNNTIPFCIVTDKKNPYADEFDEVVYMDNPSNSYLDKLRIFSCLPFARNIILDADSLVFGDISFYFDKFKRATAVSSKGVVVNKDSEAGWFTACNMGEYESHIAYSIRLHGGIYYVEKSKKAQSVYETALEIEAKYDNLKFNFFTKPSDESIMALAMALNECKPIEFSSEEFAYYPQFKDELKMQAFRRTCMLNENHVKLMHWSTGKTLRFHTYRKFVDYYNYGKPGKINYWIECKNAAYGCACWLYHIFKS